MNKGSDSRVWVDVDLSILKENFKRIQDGVRPCGVIAVLKANAYGLGARPIAESLRSAGAAGFGVAEINEGLELVDLGLPVQILGNVIPAEIPVGVANGIVFPINDLETARMISAEAVKQRRIVECQFLIDTGMGRLGLLVKDAEKTILECCKLPHLKCNGIYSHFPVAYRPDLDFSLQQVEKFRELLAKLKKQGITFDYIHMAASDGSNNFPCSYAPPFTRVRVGINLYGSFDPEGQRAFKLKPVLSLKTKLVAKRLLPAGTTIGYGCTYVTQEPMLEGTISAGYADGLPLNMSNRGYVLIRGKLCPVLGRVSMDYTNISLANVPDAEVGDDVTCIGGEGAAAISVETMAQIKGTHSYDIICSFGNRVQRRYING